MGKLVRIAGWLWFIVPLVLLSYVLWHDLHGEFLRFSYYFVVWGGLLAISGCGGWFLVGMPGAKSVLRVAATAVALYVILIFLIAWGNAPYYGGHDFVFYGYLWLLVALCAGSYFIAGHRAA